VFDPRCAATSDPLRIIDCVTDAPRIDAVLADAASLREADSSNRSSRARASARFFPPGRAREGSAGAGVSSGNSARRNETVTEEVSAQPSNTNHEVSTSSRCAHRMQDTICQRCYVGVLPEVTTRANSRAFELFGWRLPIVAKVAFSNHNARVRICWRCGNGRIRSRNLGCAVKNLPRTRRCTGLEGEELVPTGGAGRN